MKTFTLDSSLKPVPIRNNELDALKKTFAQNWVTPMKEAAYPTCGYYDYLTVACQHHLPVVLNPNDIAYIIVCELATAIAKNPKPYASLFTTTPEKKQMIIVLTSDPTKINPQLVVDKLRTRVPTNTALFLPEFSTSTPMTTMAMNIAFCDMVSPFYNYGTCLCGIPSITIGGLKEDWELLRTNLSELSIIFQGSSLYKYLSRCMNLVCEILRHEDSKYFEKMAYFNRCGSGGEHEMAGWILQFLNRRDFTQPIQTNNITRHSSSMVYTNIETNRNFKLHAGIYYSTFREEVFSPVYNAWSEELLTKEQIKAEKDKIITSEDLVDAIAFALESSPVIARTSKINVQWTEEKDQNLESFTDMTAGEELEKQLKSKETPNDPVIFKIRTPAVHVDVTKSMNDAMTKWMKEHPGEDFIKPKQ